MSEQSITKKSEKFYNKYQFPGNRPVDKDGLIFLRRFASVTKEIKRIKGKESRINVLDAGCGTGNTSVSLARQFNDIDFYCIDNCTASLEKAKTSAQQNDLNNISFKKWNLMKTLPFNFKFDIIICLGVLHHTADMQKVLINLNESLSEIGKMFVWIYAISGRYRHSLNMKLLDMLNRIRKDSLNEIQFANEFILNSSDMSVLNELTGTSAAYLIQTKAAADPVWIADQFLNPHEKLINMEEFLLLINRAGLKVKSMLGINEDVSDIITSSVVMDAFNRLSKSKRMIALDLLYKPERYFVLLNKRR